MSSSSKARELSPPACPPCPGDQLLPAPQKSPALHPYGGQGGRPGQGQGKEQLPNSKVSAKLQTELYQSTEHRKQKNKSGEIIRPQELNNPANNLKDQPQ